MLQNIKELYGHTLAALDGDAGHVKDFYFDDKTWVIRYVVADTGTWLTGRLVLLSPHAFTSIDPRDRALHLKVNRQQIENSPSIELHKPVSRQYEVEYYKYYGWPVYWNGDSMWGLGSYPLVLPPSQEQMEAHLKHHHRDDKHLQSTQGVTGYSIQASDGEIGTVGGFMVDERSWAIREIVAETGHWYSGKDVLIPAGKIRRISYEESKVFVQLTKADIERTAERHVVHAVD